MRNSTYKKDDFKRLRYDIYDLKKGDKLDFDDLPSYPVFKTRIKGIDNALIFKWICYMYDKGSPLSIISDTAKRSFVAAQTAGFPKDNQGHYVSGYFDIATQRGSTYVSIGNRIVQYCRLQRDNNYTDLVTYQLLRNRNLEKLVDPDTETDEVNKILKTQEMITDIIDKLMPMFLNGDKSEKTKQEVIDSIENESLEFSPENIVLNMHIRKRVMDSNPYGHYKFKKYSEKDLTDEEAQQLEDELNNTTEDFERHQKALGI